MPLPNILASPHWQVFSAIAYAPQGPVGDPPAQWAGHLPDGAVLPEWLEQLPADGIDRAAVREICLNPAMPVEVGYICAMAWGKQGVGPNGALHRLSAFNALPIFAPRLQALGQGGLSRIQAYNLFALPAGNNVPGLGPAFFTKLLYFFSPEPSMYIMDQWTAKSVNLLNGQLLVKMNGNQVHNQNKSGNYQAYCEDIDAIANVMQCPGQQIEEMLFSNGGHHPGAWRAYVRAYWPAFAAETPAYNANNVAMLYPHIYADNF